MNTPINKLVYALSKLPGIGEKTAARLSFFLLKAPKKIAQDLSDALRGLHEKVRLCSRCCQITEQDPCRICSDPRRESPLICVVENPSDVAALEKTQVYKGLYHVLHGALSPLEGIGPDELKIQPLVQRLEKGSCQEIILATNANVEGDATALYLARLLKPMGIKVTRLASGIPVGGELEYMDPSTLSKAMEERREIS